jgi:hypothetical protein
MHLCVLRLDVGALGEDLVDEAELAELRRQMEDGRAILQGWRSKDSGR